MSIFSGCFAGRFASDVKAERAIATRLIRKNGLVEVDPAKAEQTIWGRGKISKRMTRNFMTTMVKNDKYLIRRSDVLLVLTGDIISDGTYKEVDYAQRIEIPVVMVAPKRCSEELMGWTNILVGKDHIFPTVKRAISFIKRKYVKEVEEHKKAFTQAVRKGKSKS